ncbi:MAG: type II toxin-antitoxin system Phd/YefM family antitoxin [Deferribacteraceae bacterium]|nr:type II toxin-antitoxin system Phd/YefM family antitoxin [Deferribacteraceae bacterium]
MQVMQISDFKSNLSEVISNIDAMPISITQNGSEQAVLMSKHEYDRMMDTMYMLKIVSLGKKQIEEGKTYSLDEAVKIAADAAEDEA